MFKKKTILIIIMLVAVFFLTGLTNQFNVNAIYLKTSYNSNMEGNNYIFNSKEELTLYYETYKEEYHLDIKRFHDTIAKYDELYFENNTLILILLEESSGSISHKIEGYKIENETISFDMKKETPRYITCDMVGWHIFVEMDRNIIENINFIKVNELS